MWISPAYAQDAAGGTMAMVTQLAPLVLIFVVFYFLLIRPQQRRMKAHRDMVAAVKKGDTVVTAGGIIGKVVKVTEDEIEVELAPGTKVRVVKGTLTEVRLPRSSKPANDTAA